MDARSLVILDFSGTLSTAAPQFGRPGHLESELAKSGLEALGIGDAGTFWNEIVGPTWEEGSTTTLGYAALMADRVGKWRAERGGGTDDAAVRRAADLFVGRYLAYSAIDARWEPVLKELETAPAVLTVIATDHYAEATDVLLSRLQHMNIRGMAWGGLKGKEARKGIIIANSADLGFHKSDRPFWEALKAHISAEGIRRVLIVDDFGANEQTSDAYGAPARIAARRRSTLHMLEEVFEAPVEAIDFYCGDMTSGGSGGIDALIERTARKIQAYLERPWAPSMPA